MLRPESGGRDSFGRLKAGIPPFAGRGLGGLSAVRCEYLYIYYIEVGVSGVVVIAEVIPRFVGYKPDNNKAAACPCWSVDKATRARSFPPGFIGNQFFSDGLVASTRAI